MKKLLSSAALVICAVQPVLAKDVENITGKFFKVTSNGPVASICTTVVGKTYTRAGFQVLTPGYKFTDPLTECKIYDAATKSCYVTPISDTQCVSLTISGPVGAVDLKGCLNELGRLTCQHVSHNANVPFPNQYAYVVASNQPQITATATSIPSKQGYILACPVLDNGDKFGACSLYYDKIMKYPQAITFDTAGTHAYISNLGDGQVVSCVVDQTNVATPTFKNCVANATGIPLGAGRHSLEGTVAVTDSNVFVPDFDEATILSCPIVPGGNGALSTCVSVVTSQPSSYSPNALTIHPTHQSRLYFANTSHNTVTFCTISGGTLNSCTDSGAVITQPLSVSFNPLGDTAYIANADNKVTTCDVAVVGGTFSNCISHSSSTFSFDGLPLNQYLGAVTNIFMQTTNPYGYVPNKANNTVSICQTPFAASPVVTCTPVTPLTHDGINAEVPTGIALLRTLIPITAYGAK